MEETTNKTTIKEWAEDDRPREKLILKGKSALSDAELIAVLIGSGNRKESAVELSKRILNTSKDNLIELSKLNLNELKKFKGIGDAKAISIIAALELGRRRRGTEAMAKKKISSSRDAFELMQSNISDILHEEFWLILMDRSNQIIRKVSVSEGGFSGTIADPKKIFKLALDNFASSIILCHNHPSGNIQPSEADIKLTKKLKEAGSVLDLPVLDHIICGEEKYFSFADEGIL